MSGNTPVETNDAIRHALGYMAAMRSAIRCGESWSDEEFGSAQKVMDRLEAAQCERDQLAAHVDGLREALVFYAKPEHWMAQSERWDEDRCLVANGSNRAAGHGWEEAKAALAATPSQSLAAHDAAVKVAVLRAVAEKLRLEESTNSSMHAEFVEAEADRIEKEAANGKA